MNVVFLGGFRYPQGMAGTRRVQHTIDGLREAGDVSIRVVVLRQSSRLNAREGVYRGVPYETVMADVMRTKALLLAPVLSARAKSVVRRQFQADAANILYVYGAPALDNVHVVRHARRCGFTVVFDIVEDDDLAYGISRTLRHRIGNYFTCRLTRRISSLADGVIVISSHLQEKFRRLTQGALPIHFHPISIDAKRGPQGRQRFGSSVTLFYSGSFGVKDGVPELLGAFDLLAARNGDIRLTLTGKGSNEVMKRVLSRIDASPYRDRIEYTGYLDEDGYYAALNAADIPCMTRVNTGYANAGFPFKLGEFLATAKPTIASRVSDVGRLLEDRREAMLVEPGSSASIVSAVEYLMADPERAASIGWRGWEKARQLFDYRAHGSALLGFLHGLASSSGAADMT